jgi:hypothetical protein
MACSLIDLNRLATKFRAAIFACDKKRLFITLQRFPNGACGDASYLLAKYFEEQGCGQFEYVLGERRPNYRSHAWLENNGVIVDITADQFEGIDNPVMITTDRAWHAQFVEKDRHIADYERYDSNTVSNLRASYELVVNQIET